MNESIFSVGDTVVLATRCKTHKLKPFKTRGVVKVVCCAYYMNRREISYNVEVDGKTICGIPEYKLMRPGEPREMFIGLGITSLIAVAITATNYLMR